MKLTRLPEAAAWCMGKKTGMATYPRTDDGQCVRWMSMELPQQEMFV